MPGEDIIHIAREAGYDHETCITAGELREGGITVPDSIPDHGWVPRNALTYTLTPITTQEDFANDILRMKYEITFGDPFQWVDVSQNPALKRVHKKNYIMDNLKIAHLIETNLVFAHALTSEITGYGKNWNLVMAARKGKTITCIKSEYSGRTSAREPDITTDSELEQNISAGPITAKDGHICCQLTFRNEFNHRAYTLRFNNIGRDFKKEVIEATEVLAKVTRQLQIEDEERAKIAAIQDDILEYLC